MYKFVFILSVLVIGLSSCKKEKQPEKTQAEFIAELENSPDTVGIGNHIFVLNAQLVRNFMPVCEENGDPMYCVIELADITNMGGQNTAVLKRQYSIQGDQLWSKEITPTNSGEPSIKTGVAYGGPKWEPNTQADVVCEFEFAGATKRIIIKSRNVNAVY